MLAGVVDDAIDITAERRAVDAVWREELLCLACVVELPDEKIRHGVMRQTR